MSADLTWGQVKAELANVPDDAVVCVRVKNPMSSERVTVFDSYCITKAAAHWAAGMNPVVDLDARSAFEMPEAECSTP